MARSTRGRRTFMTGWALVTFALAMIAAWKWMEASEQESHRLRYARQLLVANTGMRLPSDAEVLEADDLRGRSEFDFFFWTVWSSEQIQLPSFHEDVKSFVAPESVEFGVEHFDHQGYVGRIGVPQDASLTVWHTPQWQLRAVVLRGTQGSLLSVTRVRTSQKASENSESTGSERGASEKD